MNFTVFLGNLPTWVTADDIKAWLTAEGLVADSVKVIRNHETQESKGFAFVEAPTADEMQAIIRRFDRAPLEDRLLRANPAQPSKGKEASKPVEASRAAQWPQAKARQRRSPQNGVRRRVGQSLIISGSVAPKFVSPRICAYATADLFYLSSPHTPGQITCKRFVLQSVASSRRDPAAAPAGHRQTRTCLC